MTDEAINIPYDAGDPAHVRKARKTAKVSAASEEQTVRLMLATEESRRFWWDLLSSCGVFRAEFVPPEHLLFLTGQRNIGLMLLAKIPPDLYKVMTEEAQERGKVSNAP